MRTAAVLALVLVAACSDYEFAKVDAPNLGAPDTGLEPGTGTTDEVPVCDETAPDAVAVPQDATCAAEPEVGVFDPVIEWRWTDNPVHDDFEQIMAAPVVSNLNDDNGDGVVDDGDIPDIVFAAFSRYTSYRSPGVVVALSGADGSTLWSRKDLGGGVQPYGCAGVAVGDVDGTGPSVFVMTTAGLARLDAEGTLQWVTALSTSHPYGYVFPALGDLDHDGVSEIAAGPAVLDASGGLLWEATGGTGYLMSFFADLDQDGAVEVVAGNTVYNSDGTTRWSEGDDGYAAVGDLDQDGDPEIVVVVPSVGISARHHDGTLFWDLALDDLGGGPPTIADFDGDGEAEIGLASEYWYRVLDSDGAELWRSPVQDSSSKRTGSSVFDFEGDGAAEVVYADEETLWVYDGATGAVELALDEHSSGTLVEYPLVVDVDNDGSAEIVAIANDYSTHRDSRGIAVIGDASSSWAPARPVWNQHTYAIVGIADDGSVPATTPPSWTLWNSFRAGNSETRVGLDLPDLRVGDPEVCLDECESTGEALVWIPIENGGLAGAEAVFVSLYAVDGDARTRVHTEELSRVDAGTETFLAPLRVTEEDFGPGGLLIVVDDDGVESDRIEECKEANNSALLPRFPC